MQSTRPELGIDGLKNLYTTVPPKKEQDEIAKYLEIKCQLVNSLLSNKASQLELLKRQRQSLIYEYVTGKKRVPGYGKEA